MKSSIYLLITAALVLSGCQNLPGQASNVPVAGARADAPAVIARREVTIMAEIPTGLAPGQELMIEFLDELTGLAINPERIPMQPVDETHFMVTREVTERAIIKYRYYRKGDNPSFEYNAIDRPVRYRFVFTAALSEVHDLISGWADSTDQTPTGMLEGRIIDSDTHDPIGGILVACGGDQVISLADGTYRFEELTPGLHTLSALSMEGRYFPFQQQAIVATNSRTQADFSLHPAPFASVEFNLDVTGNQLESNTIRIIGENSAFGDTYSNQGADQSVLARLAPEMQAQPDGTFKAVFQLPVGQVFSYKYTLGDGLWNSERQADGGFFKRQILVMEDDQIIHDHLQSFGPSNGSAVVFNLEIPENTPGEENISIQLNPFDWSPPLTMTKTGDRQYQYTLFGPQDLLGEITYRYCRSAECENVPFTSNGEDITFQSSFQSEESRKEINDSIPAWADWQPTTDPTVVLSTEAVVRQSSFIGGMDLAPYFTADLITYADKGWNAISHSGANTVFIEPTWETISTDPLIARQLAGRDMGLSDLRDAVETARQRKIQVGFFPRVMAAADRDLSSHGIDPANVNPGQWAEMIDRFYEHFAIAAQADAVQYLIVDGAYLNWRDESAVVELLINIRQKFKNKVLVAANPAQFIDIPVELLGQFDGLYIILECPLFAYKEDQSGELPVELANLLDKTILPKTSVKNLPVVLGVDFPAVNAAGSICYQTSREWTQYRENLPAIDTQSAELAVQTEIYNQIFSAVATRNWIAGLVSRGFTMEAARMDSSTSVNGKPAADILWYWFTRLEK